MIALPLLYIADSTNQSAWSLEWEVHLFFFPSFCLEWYKEAIYSLEDGNWNAARVIWSLSSMYSHMCQDLAEGEMRR